MILPVALRCVLTQSPELRDECHAGAPAPAVVLNTLTASNSATMIG
jgi:hypothetical protein